jgi:hypothetical protein
VSEEGATDALLDCLADLIPREDGCKVHPVQPEKAIVDKSDASWGRQLLR